MLTDTMYGTMNGHAAGIILKEAARRAMSTIFNERLLFEATVKESYGGTMDDVFTSADTKAQEVYLRMFRECFPGYGVIAEEDELTISPQGGCQAYFTVDPLDGTKAYVRRQSHGVATMVALIDDWRILAAYVGDVNTNELYGFRPGSEKVHRITHLDSFERMGRTEATASGEVFLLLRDPIERAYGSAAQKLVTESPHIKNYEVMGSSIGTWMARLWKNEVTGVLIPPGFETPWDSNPVNGITQKLGYVYLRLDSNDRWVPFEPLVLYKKTRRIHDVLVVHQLDAHLFT